jgi:hypothetical protein
MKKLTCLFAMVVLVGCLLLTSPVQAQIPAGALLWLKADAGVITDGTGVATWQDQSGHLNHATRARGTMQKTTRIFNNGAHDVIRFKRDGYFILTDSSSLSIQDLTIYAVVENTGAERREYFSNYSNAINWGYGYSVDMEGTSVRAFTSAGTQATYSDWVIAGPAALGMHCLSTAINASANTKSIYAEGNLLNTTTVPGLSYQPDCTSIGTLGRLALASFYFRGDIAEIIVYGSVDDAQRTAVETYLINKYGLAPKCGDWGYLGSDVNQDCKVNLADFAILANQWLKCTDPVGTGCTNLNP